MRVREGGRGYYVDFVGFERDLGIYLKYER